MPNFYGAAILSFIFYLSSVNPTSKHHAVEEQQRNPTTTMDDSSVPEQMVHQQNLFTEYLSRGMFTCAANYVGTLRKMNRMIMTAYEEYTRCQNMLNALDQEDYNKAKRQFQAQMEMIQDLLD